MPYTPVQTGNNNTPKRPASSPLNQEETPLWAKTMMNNMKSMIEDIRIHISSEVATVKQDIIDLKSSIDANTTAIKQHDEAINSLKQLQESNKLIDIEVNRLAQSQLVNNLIISNIPKQNNEDISCWKQCLDKIVKLLKIDVNFEKDVMEILRLPTKNASNAGPILVKFYTQRPKLEIFKNKALQSIRVGQILNNTSTDKVYFSHHLTRHNQELFRSLRQHNARHSKYKFVWFSSRQNGIYAKKDETSRALLISTENDFSLLPSAAHIP